MHALTQGAKGPSAKMDISALTLKSYDSLDYNDQYAFRPTGSTTAAPIAILHSITHLLSSNPYVIVIALDFSKALWYCTTCRAIPEARSARHSWRSVYLDGWLYEKGGCHITKYVVHKVHKFVKFWRLQLKSVTSAITKIAIKTSYLK